MLVILQCSDNNCLYDDIWFENQLSCLSVTIPCLAMFLMISDLFTCLALFSRKNGSVSHVITIFVYVFMRGQRTLI